MPKKDQTIDGENQGMNCPNCGHPTSEFEGEGLSISRHCPSCFWSE